MRPLMVADPMLRAPSPEIVSESNLGAGVCAIAAVAGTKASTRVQNQSLEYVFIGESSWIGNVLSSTVKVLWLLWRARHAESAIVDRHVSFDLLVDRLGLVLAALG